MRNSSAFFKYFLFFLIAFSFTQNGWPDNIASLHQSTEAIVNINSQIKSNQYVTNASHIQSTITLLQTRQNQLIEGLQSNPAEFLKFLLTDKNTSALPKQLQAYVEHEVKQIEGVVEVRAALYLAGNTQQEALQYVLTMDDGKKYNLVFYPRLNTTLITGQRIRLQSAFKITTSTTNQLIADPTSLTVLSTKNLTAIPSAFGPQKTYVFLVNFQDKPTTKPWTLDQIKNLYFNTVNKNYLESSYSQTTVVGDASGWYTLPINSTDTCNNITDKVPTMAMAAAKNAGINTAGYAHYIYFFPYTASCNWGGLATVGGSPNTGWINGQFYASTTGHELGHNLGLYHSHLWQCSNGPNQGTCTSVEYGDQADIMGFNPSIPLVAHFNAFQKDRLGWLNYQSSPPIQTITNSGTYNIDAYETANSSVKALKIPKSTTGDYYYVEYRQPIGNDSALNCATCDFTKGVIIHQANVNDPNSSYLLQMTPSANLNAVALLPGKTFSDPSAPNGGLSITLNSISATGANVTATVGTQPPVCNRVAPTLSINPTTTQWVNAGAGATYSLTLKNNDGANCSASNFTLSTTPVNSVTSTINNPQVTLAPGTSTTTALQINSSTNTPPAIYTIAVRGVSANLPNNPASVNASFGVQSNCVRAVPIFKILPGSQKGRRGQSLKYSYVIQNNDSKSCGPSLFNITANVSPMLTIAYPNSITMDPQSSQSIDFTVTSSLRTMMGVYPLTLTATSSVSGLSQAAYATDIVVY